MRASTSAAPIGRLKWHSRRALLELDIVLERFWQRLGETEPTMEQRMLLEEMLQLEDHDLWDILCARQDVPDVRWVPMIETLMKV